MHNNNDSNNDNSDRDKDNIKNYRGNHSENKKSNNSHNTNNSSKNDDICGFRVTVRGLGLNPEALALNCVNPQGIAASSDLSTAQSVWHRKFCPQNLMP